MRIAGEIAVLPGALTVSIAHSVSSMGRKDINHTAGALFHVLIVIVVAQITAERRIVDKRISLPTHFKIEIAQWIFELVRHHDIRVFRQ
ncbi:hypothetical protein WM25_32900 [Burkholderia ubonensis]|nr:hypothetical protein WM25_32900 [Burkholderia ubonensis]